jgi:hypothetical protein
LVTYDFDMDVIDDLFSETNVVSTRQVARAFDLSENDARNWADRLQVARVGASFAWSLPDVERLAEALEADKENSDVGTRTTRTRTTKTRTRTNEPSP